MLHRHTMVHQAGPMLACTAALCMTMTALVMYVINAQDGKRKRFKLPEAGYNKICLRRQGAGTLPPDALLQIIEASGAVQKLGLSGFGITALPIQSLCQLQALTRLDLSQNSLASLPGEIGLLTALVDLDLSRNELCALPSSLGRLTCLRLLNCMANRLQSVPEEIGDLATLYRLGLKVRLRLLNCTAKQL